MSTSTHPSWAAVVAAWVEGSDAVYQDPLAPQPVAEAVPPVVEAEEPVVEAEDLMVPSAAELGIDVSDLPPRRADLVRLVAYIAKSRDEREAIAAGRERYLQAMQLPSLTRQQIADLRKGDAAGAVAFIEAGGEGLEPVIRRAERKQLQARLATLDEPEAETARAALEHADRRLTEVDQRITRLEALQEPYALAVLQELAEPMGEQMCAALKQAEAAARWLVALGSLTGSPFYSYYGDPGLDVRLPRFGLSSILDYCRAEDRTAPAIKVDSDRVHRDARVLLALRAQLLADPRADVQMPGGGA